MIPIPDIEPRKKIPMPREPCVWSVRLCRTTIDFARLKSRLAAPRTSSTQRRGGRGLAAHLGDSQANLRGDHRRNGFFLRLDLWCILGARHAG